GSGYSLGNLGVVVRGLNSSTSQVVWGLLCGLDNVTRQQSCFYGTAATMVIADSMVCVGGAFLLSGVSGFTLPGGCMNVSGSGVVAAANAYVGLPAPLNSGGFASIVHLAHLYRAPSGLHKLIMPCATDGTIILYAWTVETRAVSVIDPITV